MLLAVKKDTYYIKLFFFFVSDQQSEIVYEPKVNIDFVKLHKPVDEPHCGYDGTKCPRDQNSWIYSAIILGGN